MSFPDVEDEPEKLRRNTLAFSVFTIIFFFLELRFPETLLGFARPVESDGKIWFLIVIFSVYFFARYHYSDDAGRLALLVSQHKNDLPRKFRQRGVNLMLRLYRRNIRGNFLSDSILHATSEMAADDRTRPGATIVLKDVTVEAYNPDNARRIENQIGYTFTYLDSIHEYVPTQYLEVKWPSWFSAWVWCRVWQNMMTNPKFIVNVYIPYLLFFMALAFTAYRFWGATLVAAFVGL